MDIPTTALIPHDLVTQVCADRNTALTAFDTYFTTVGAARSALHTALKHYARATGGSARWPDTSGESQEFFDLIKQPDLSAIEHTTQRIVDTGIWQYLVSTSGLATMMDATAKAELDAQLSYVPPNAAHSRNQSSLATSEQLSPTTLPPITVENIEATLEAFRAQAPSIVARGIAEAFSALDNRFKTHNGFKVGYCGPSSKTAGRIILNYAVGDTTWCSTDWHDEYKPTSAYNRLLDVERCFRALDGKSVAGNWLEDSAVKTVMRERKANKPTDIMSRRTRTWPSTHDTEYFIIRIFAKGTCHVWFKRADLVRRVNDILAKYYGATLGWGVYGEKSTEDPLRDAEHRPLAPRLGEYFTPATVVDFVRARTHYERLTKESLCLEPSAGSGNLASVLTDLGLRTDCVEIQPALARVLQNSGMYNHVYFENFLHLPVQPKYSGVLMNPPFNYEGGIDHANRALQFLDTSSPFEFAAILGASARYSATSKATAFRAKIDRLASEWDAMVTWYDLPPRSFVPAGTNVNTVLLTIRK